MPYTFLIALNSETSRISAFCFVLFLHFCILISIPSSERAGGLDSPNRVVVALSGADHAITS